MFSLKSVIKTPTVEFLCAKEDHGVIPPPVPARKVLPEWFKNLPPKIDNKNKLQNSTIKRCMPVLDALNAGWIIPLAADVEFITNSDASQVSTKSRFAKTLVESHSAAQIAGHPHLPKPAFKWLNYWMIKLPPGYSMLFVPPLNRYEDRFQCFSGMVDDTYMGNGAMEYINFPFFFMRENYTGIVKQGTPLVQAIPIKRGRVDETISIMTEADHELHQLTKRRHSAHESIYRDSLRQPK